MFRLFPLFFLLMLLGCTSTIPSYKIKSEEPTILFSQDSLDVFITIPNDYPNSSIVINSILHQSPDVLRKKVANDFEYDDMSIQTLELLPDAFFRYILIQTQDMPEDKIKYTFSVPKSTIHETLNKYTIVPETIYPLFQKELSIPNLSVYENLKLPLPCDGVPVPDNPVLLPNAPRKYRNGTHRGIDFYANWGTPVKTVSDGVVIRADHNFTEIPAEFRVSLLDKTTKVGRTPSDIFEHILVGQSVYIDHGFDLIPGYRCISIYAHLSHIEKNIIPGTKVTQGQVLGQSGNSGTKPSTLGTRGGSHLHWELILQDESGEYFLGQGIGVNIADMLGLIFY